MFSHPLSETQTRKRKTRCGDRHPHKKKSHEPKRVEPGGRVAYVESGAVPTRARSNKFGEGLLGREFDCDKKSVNSSSKGSCVGYLILGPRGGTG